MRVSPHDASSDPDDGVFMLDAICGHADKIKILRGLGQSIQLSKFYHIAF
jgi:hypothetical protein